ncbi:MAG TPA: DegQ family serine endoprotease [Vicinamibacterales bacterium]|nr:DegQ family serine endoprotease [Vicinamibacterales bacterium]
MDTTPTNLKQRTVRGAVALGAASLLVAGATWHGFAAEPAAPSITSAAMMPAAQTPTASRAVVAGGRDSYADIVKAVAPAVVTVQVEGKARVSPTQFGGGDDEDMLRRFFGDRFGQGRGQLPRMPRQRGLGSGVVVTADGYILTNNHVIDSADEIRVEFNDGRSFKATLVGADKPSDLALLKIEQTGLPTLPLGNSDGVQVGDVVLAVGNPLGIGQTVTMGIVSAKGRSTGSGDGSYEDFLQTDAPINHGNSGGALVNMKGELVGINSQIVSQSDGNIGIGFAIPANMARHVMDSLKSDGRVRRSQLGVTVQPVTSEMAESLGLKEVSGAIVSSVAPGSAAERAGVKRGDVIKSFNGQPIHDFNALRNRVADSTPGSNASVVVVRDGSEKTLTVKLDEAAQSRQARERADDATDDKAALGVAVSPLSPELASRAGLGKDARGVVVQDVNPDGRAADAGIQAGDIILEVNRQPVQTVDELRAAVRKAAEKPTLLLVRRSANGEGRDLFVTVRPQ